MLFKVCQVKVDKNNREYYVLVNKDNNECWKFVSLWDKEGVKHQLDEVIEFDDSKVKYEEKISETGEHIGAKYLQGTWFVEKKEWDYRKATLLDKMKLTGFQNAKVFKCCSIKNRGLFDHDNKFIGINENEWVVTFINSQDKLEVQKTIKTPNAKKFFDGLLHKNVQLWYDVKKSKVGGEFMGLEVKLCQ